MMRLRRLWPTSKGHKAVLAGLGVLLAAGVGLRISLVLTRSPGFFGNGDSLFYIRAAHGDLFGPAQWPAGYALFLRSAHALDPNLWFTIVLQHAMGVITALLLFATVRRVASSAWALIPAGVVLLAGPQVLLEHAPMSETLFAFLIAATCYCAVRALDERRPRWAFAVGVLGVAAGCVRPVGLLLTVVAIVWLVAATPGALSRRLLAGGAVALSAWLLVATYVVAARQQAGYVGPGLSRAGGWVFYSRVAPFADCGRFDPPPRTRGLCERRPPARRPGAWVYAVGESPAARVFGGWGVMKPADDKALSAFARAAIVHQPFDYLRAIGTDLTRFWSSSTDFSRGRAGLDYDALAFDLSKQFPPIATIVGNWYPTGAAPRPGAPAGLAAYERHTRLEGPALLLLVGLALIGVPLARGRRLAVGILLLAVSAAVLIGPIATLFFDARYVVPGYGPLAAAGAIGAATLWERAAAAWLARRRTTVELPERVAV